MELNSVDRCKGAHDEKSVTEVLVHEGFRADKSNMLVTQRLALLK